MYKTNEFDIDRTKYMTTEFSKYVKEFAESVTGKGALLYAGGPAIHHSDSRNFDCNSTGAIVAKSQMGVNVMQIAKLFTNMEFEYVSINANTCASSMYCIYEAKQLIDNGYEKVVVVALDMVENSELRLFEQLGVDIVCGDGIGVLVFSELSNGSIARIDDVVWKWNNDRSPMSVSSDGYMRVLGQLDLSSISVVKPHGTGTDRNDEAENEALVEVGLGCVEKKMYKQLIGHTQGASTAIELGMLLDDMESETKGLVLASGMGGFYGGCTVWKLK